MKNETMHEAVMRNGKPATRCGRGFLQRTRVVKNVTCGRCKLLAKFAAKRAKKGGK